MALAALGALVAAGSAPAVGTAEASVRKSVKDLPRRDLTEGAIARLIRLDFLGAGVLPWRAPAPPTGPEEGLREWPAPRDLVLAWRRFLEERTPRDVAQSRGPRLAVQVDTLAAWRTMAFARVLDHPAVGACNAHLTDLFTSDGRTDWCWPFSVAALPGDPVCPSFGSRQRGFPEPWPFRFVTAGREEPRVEVLVIGAPAREALMRVLSCGLPLRCCLVVVAGLGADSERSAEPLLRALVSCLSAEGLAVVEPCSDPAEFANRLDRFAHELTHNQPLDVALGEAFPQGRLLLLNHDLLALSRLGSAVVDLARRLHQLPPGSQVTLSERSFVRLQARGRRVRSAGPTSSPRSRSAPARGRKDSAPPVPMLVASSEALARALGASQGAYHFVSEGHEASALSELSRSVHRQEGEAARSKPVPRYLQQRSYRKAGGGLLEDNAGYVLAEPVMVELCIGPTVAGRVTAPTAFPEDKLPKDRKTNRLQLVFHEPRQFDRPMLAEIDLPQEGESTRAEFVFTPREPGEFVARITVLHRGRVLQTMLLCATVVADRAALSGVRTGISLHDEVQVRHDWSDLGARRRFDLALVLNHSAAGQPLLTGVSGQQAWATDLTGIEQPVRRLNDLISQVAHSAADYLDGLDQGENPKLLVQLARVGSSLYTKLYRDQLKPLSSEGFDVGSEAVTHIQVVSTRPDAVVPLEFLYDFNAPDPGSPVCPQHREALTAGRCPENCARRSRPRGYVCPMGFWGLKKVIERHMYDARKAGPGGAILGIQAEPAEGRNRLALQAGMVVGYSKEVRPKVMTPMVRQFAKQLGFEVPLARDWEQWLEIVKERRPGLLLAFPHNEGREEDVRLEIGGAHLYTLDLPPEYVRPPDGPQPLVVLLGCDVASTAQDFASHVCHFRLAGAAVVVSTIATVFGEHAVQVGRIIVTRLLASGDAPVLRLGEVLRDAKRAALLQSVPMALCVVAFGDADWRL